MLTSKADERHVTCVIHAKPEYEARVRELLERCVTLSREEPGCLHYDLYQVRDRASTFVLVDGWASDEAVASHLAEPEIITIMKELETLVSAPQDITISTRLSDYA
ncbi:putative quinol monooxygenase [Sphingobium sp. H39-3-25]|uniref:putative quinol monooxygenase n=1 Tax=Sphingobium arseniciresistens TaxID=3030834 RepID=UPI0023B92864|nr:putative quinol monooxygenase [Sphingobium arseniciresistens]